jgi:hypothetical protein
MSLRLTHKTTLDFLIDDYFLGDNGGGVTLNISSSSVPEPAAITLLGTAAVIGIGYAASRWRRVGVRGPGIEKRVRSIS